jgi:ubiquinone/menaquinone biosynthesis C-methylase UbiE
MTKEVFDAMAPGWYNFRHRTIFRRELEELAERWGRGKLLNIGCAHGPDFIPFKDNFELHGVDISPAMLEMAKKYAAKYQLNVTLVEADARKLPYPDGAFDFAVAVASFHHIEEKDGRLKAFEELRRVLKPGGEAFITVWNKWQPRFWLKSKNTLVPWRSGDKVVRRYYYLFSYGELAKLARRAGLEIVRVFPESAYKFPLKWFSRNICMVVRKKSV